MSQTLYSAIQTGNDGSAGTLSSPFRSMAFGLSRIGAGDTLLVGPGTYNEYFSNSIASGSSWNDKVRIAAYPGESVWVRPPSDKSAFYFGNDVGGTIYNPQYIEIDGINIDARDGIGYSPLFLDTRGGSSPHHIRFQNSHIINARAENTNNVGAAVKLGDHPGTVSPQGVCTYCEIINVEIEGTDLYGIYITGDNNLIDNCNIHHVSSLGIQIYDNVRSPSGNILRNNRIHDIYESWFFNVQDIRIGGMLITGGTHLIYNNLIYKIHLLYSPSPPSPYGGVTTYSVGGDRFICNNTIYDIDGPTFNVGAGGSGTIFKNNIGFRTGFDGITDSGSGTIQSNNLFGVDPKFVNAAADDFRLQDGSLALDTGVAV